MDYTKIIELFENLSDVDRFHQLKLLKQGIDQIEKSNHRKVPMVLFEHSHTINGNRNQARYEDEFFHLILDFIMKYFPRSSSNWGGYIKHRSDPIFIAVCKTLFDTSITIEVAKVPLGKYPIVEVGGGAECVSFRDSSTYFDTTTRCQQPEKIEAFLDKLSMVGVGLLRSFHNRSKTEWIRDDLPRYTKTLSKVSAADYRCYQEGYYFLQSDAHTFFRTNGYYIDRFRLILEVIFNLSKEKVEEAVKIYKGDEFIFQTLIDFYTLQKEGLLS